MRQPASTSRRPGPHRRGAMARVAPEVRDPDHHLWLNGRTWWIAFTAHDEAGRVRRVRRSLRTRGLHEARRRRDRVLAGYGALTGCVLSLRYIRAAS